MARLLVAALLAAALASSERTIGAQTPGPVELSVLTTAGPDTAVSGQEITYMIHYRLASPPVFSSATVAVEIPRFTTYVSTRTVLGTPGVLSLPSGGPAFVVRWGGLGSTEEPEGSLELVVRINGGYAGTIVASAYVPGMTGATVSNVVRTQVHAPGTLPVSGSGPSRRDFGGYITALALLGGALLAAGAAVAHSTGLAIPRP